MADSRSLDGLTEVNGDKEDVGATRDYFGTKDADRKHAVMRENLLPSGVLEWIADGLTGLMSCDPRPGDIPAAIAFVRKELLQNDAVADVLESDIELLQNELLALSMKRSGLQQQKADLEQQVAFQNKNQQRRSGK